MPPFTDHRVGYDSATPSVDLNMRYVITDCTVPGNGQHQRKQRVNSRRFSAH